MDVTADSLRPPVALQEEMNPAGCGGLLAWLGAAFVLPVFSATFYYRAARSRLIYAMAFFFLFALVLSSVQTLGVVRGTIQTGQEIRRAYSTGKFPVIQIEAGEAIVEGPQPYILVDEERTFIAVDTSGIYTDIDTERYEQGLLLTKRSLIYLTSNGEYQKLPLRDLQLAMNANPIVLDAEGVSSLWTIFSAFTALATLFGLLLWNTFARLTTLLAAAMVLWGITMVVKRETRFAEVLAPGIYAVVPAVYASNLLQQVGADFLGLFTLLLCLFWAAGLFLALNPKQAAASSPGRFREYWSSIRPPRLWRAWIGLPLLLFLAGQIIFGWLPWYLSWAAAILTLAGLAAVSLLPVLQSSGSESGEAVHPL
jgi:hypothetical protein